MLRYIVVHKEHKTKIIRSFKERGEANYFITDCFGPESSQYEIIEVEISNIPSCGGNV